jgi:hypothetical protein
MSQRSEDFHDYIKLREALERVLETRYARRLKNTFVFAKLDETVDLITHEIGDIYREMTNTKGDSK